MRWEGYGNGVAVSLSASAAASTSASASTSNAEGSSTGPGTLAAAAPGWEEWDAIAVVAGMRERVPEYLNVDGGGEQLVFDLPGAGAQEMGEVYDEIAEDLLTTTTTTSTATSTTTTSISTSTTGPSTSIGPVVFYSAQSSAAANAALSVVQSHLGAGWEFSDEDGNEDMDGAYGGDGVFTASQGSGVDGVDVDMDMAELEYMDDF